MSGRSHRDIAADEVEWRDGGGDGIRYTRFRMDGADPTAPTIILSRLDAEVARATYGSRRRAPAMARSG